jgi:hypothetical protein
MREAAALIAIVLVVACGNGSSRPPPPPTPTPTPPTAAGCAAQVKGEPIKMTEGTNPQLSGFDAGTSNIFERDGRLSGSISIHDPASGGEGKVERVIVYAGTEFTVNGDRYCTIDVQDGKDGPGWLLVGKL